MRVPNQPMYRRFSVLVIQLENFSQVEVSCESRFWTSIGVKEAAPNFISDAKVSATSVGTKFKDEEPVREKVLDAARGTEKASEVDANRATSKEHVIFILAVFLCSNCVMFVV